MRKIWLRVGLCAAAFLFAFPSLAQDIAVGLKGGFLLTSDIRDISGQPESKRYVFGPAIEMKLPSSLALDISALYRRIGYSTIFLGTPSVINSWIRGNSWEIPVAVKHYFPSVRSSRSSTLPFISGGYVLRRVSGLKEIYVYPEPRIENGVWVGYNLVRQTMEGNATHETTHGITAGGGIRLGSGRIHVTPEVRYTAWMNLPFEIYGSRGYRVYSSRNQLDFLLQFSFGTGKK